MANVRFNENLIAKKTISTILNCSQTFISTLENISAPRLASSKAISWGVVTITAPKKSNLEN